MLYLVLSYILYVIHGLSCDIFVVHGFILRYISYTWFYPRYYMLYMVLSYDICVIHGFILHIICYTWFYPVYYMLYIVLSYVLSIEDFYPVLYKFRRHLSMCLSNVYQEITRY